MTPIPSLSLSNLVKLLRGLKKLKPVSGGWLAVILLWLVVLAAVWWLLPYLQINGQHLLISRAARLIFSLLWILLALIVLLWQLWRTVRRLARQPATPPPPPDQREIWTKYQQRFLDGWLAALRAYAGQNALYRLPWYLVMGLPGSGKTSLIHRANTASRLNTRLNSELRELAKHQYIDGWLGEQAVILDPKGQLLLQPDTENQTNGTSVEQEAEKTASLWHHLLNWLNENRRRQPLNGLVLTIDLAWLAQSSVTERKAWAQIIRTRLLDIAAILNTRLPLYLVLTRLDMLRGFDSFYRKQDSQSRQSVLGVSFTSGHHNPQGWAQELSQFWQQWISRLNSQMADQLLASSGEPETEAGLFSFIRQLNGLADYINSMLEEAIIHEPHHLLMVRGLYLSSVYQQGVPSDVFAQATAWRYRLPSAAWPARRGESTVFFVRNLFSDIIFPQAYLAGENRLYRLWRQRRLSAGITLMMLAAALLTGGWQYYYHLNRQAADRVLENTRQFISTQQHGEITGSHQPGDFGVSLLPRLNLIRAATFGFGDYRHKPALLADMGLYQGNKIGPYVENSYLQLLQQHFLPAVMQGLAEDLAKAPPLSEQKLNILRIMRMIDDGSGRNKTLVDQFMAQRWQRAFPQQGQIQQQLMQHLDYALDHTDWHAARQQRNAAAITGWQPFADPVADAQTELRKLPLFLRVYQNLETKAHEALSADLQICDEVGQTCQRIFTPDSEIAGHVPRFYTWQGLIEHFIPQHSALYSITAEDAWVLGLRENVQLSDADWQEIQRQVRDKYITDYISHWQAMLGSLNVQPFTTTEQAMQILSDITGSEQPFRRVIATLDNNTRLRTLDNNASGQHIIRHIAAPFSAADNTLVSQGDATPAIAEASQKLLAVYQWLEQINRASDPGQAALKAVQQQLTDPYSDPVSLLQQYARTQPAPVNRWLKQIADHTAALTVNLALSSLNQSWQDQVISPFNQQLADRYPFNPDSDQDVALSAMETFFASGGTLDSFYQTSIKPLVDAGLLNSRQASVEQKQLFSQLKRAQHIRDTLLNSQGSLEYHFTVEPLELSASKRRSVLDLDGQLVDYAHGRRLRTPLVWPNTMRAGSQSKLTLVPDNRDRSPRSLVFSGPWAMFRLTDSGQILRISADSFDVRFTVDNGSMTYRIYTDENRNPFNRGMFSQFRLPDSLY